MGAKCTVNRTKSSTSILEYNENELNPRSSQKVKILQTVQNKFAVLGICRELVTQTHLYNGRIWTAHFLLGTATVSNYLYIFHGAQSFSEYTQSSYFCSVCISIFLIYKILILKAKKLFETIDDCEILVNASK